MDPEPILPRCYVILGSWPMGRQKGEPAKKGKHIHHRPISTVPGFLLGVFGILCPLSFFLLYFGSKPQQPWPSGLLSALVHTPTLQSSSPGCETALLISCTQFTLSLSLSLYSVFSCHPAFTFSSNIFKSLPPSFSPPFLLLLLFFFSFSFTTSCSSSSSPTPPSLYICCSSPLLLPPHIRVLLPLLALQSLILLYFFFFFLLFVILLLSFCISPFSRLYPPPSSFLFTLVHISHLSIITYSRLDQQPATSSHVYISTLTLKQASRSISHYDQQRTILHR